MATFLWIFFVNSFPPENVSTLAMQGTHSCSRRHSLEPGDSSFRFVEIVVLVVLCALQGQLKGETILRDLIDPNPRCNLNCS